MAGARVKELAPSWSGTALMQDGEFEELSSVQYRGRATYISYPLFRASQSRAQPLHRTVEAWHVASYVEERLRVTHCTNIRTNTQSSADRYHVLFFYPNDL